MAYIRTASAHESPIIFIQIEQDGKISKETFLSVYPGACGMFFHHKKNDYAITITNGRFNPPPEGWRGTVFYPLYDEYEDDDNDGDFYEEDNYYDDGYQYDHEGFKNNVGEKSAQKEDVNQLYYDLLNNDNDDGDDYDLYDNDDGDDDDLYDDDE